MSPFIIAPEIVRDFLSKPIELQKEWKLASGQPLTGQECALFYSLDEKAMIDRECDRLYAGFTADHGNSFTLTAGAPGAGKTTLLNAWAQARPNGQRGVYADPDETVLKFMAMYLDDLASQDPVLGTLAGAYTKWRWASNFISGAIMNRAAAEGKNIIHGTTGTSPVVKILYQNVRNAGYSANTLIVAAPEEVRLESARRRYEEEKSRFTPDADIVAKGRMFYERLPVYFDETQSFDLFWRGDASSGPVLAAQAEDGSVRVADAAAVRAFDRDISTEGSGHTWDQLAARYRSRFTPAP